MVFYVTVDPPLSGHPLSGHTLLNGHMSKFQKYLVYIIKDTTSIEWPPLLSGRGHLQVVLSSVFLIIITVYSQPVFHQIPLSVAFL